MPTLRELYEEIRRTPVAYLPSPIPETLEPRPIDELGYARRMGRVLEPDPDMTVLFPRTPGAWATRHPKIAGALEGAMLGLAAYEGGTPTTMGDISGTLRNWLALMQARREAPQKALAAQLGAGRTLIEWLDAQRRGLAKEEQEARMTPVTMARERAAAEASLGQAEASRAQAEASRALAEQRRRPEPASPYGGFLYTQEEEGGPLQANIVTVSPEGGVGVRGIPTAAPVVRPGTTPDPQTVALREREQQLRAESLAIQRSALELRRELQAAGRPLQPREHTSLIQALKHLDELELQTQDPQTRSYIYISRREILEMLSRGTTAPTEPQPTTPSAPPPTEDPFSRFQQ